MLYAPLWTASILGASWLMPQIPVFKNRYKQIHDADQKQLDILDRTIGQLVNSVIQTLIVGWALYNLVIEDATDSLNACVVGFYLYDILHLYRAHYGKTQTMYIIHHALTIILIVYIQYIATGYNTFANVNYILLEFSSTSINVVNILKFFNPGSNSAILSGINVCIYFLTRVFFYPLNLLLLTYCIYESDIPAKYLYIPPVTILGILFGVCIWWFIALLKKHLETHRKLLDEFRLTGI
jgi:hypothetical protein